MRSIVRRAARFSRLTTRTARELVEALESRQMLASTQFFDPVGGGNWLVEATGANAAIVVTLGNDGARSIVITGTTASSNVTISPGLKVNGGGGAGGARVSTPQLEVSLLQVQGDVNSITTHQDVRFERETGQGGFAGIQVTGRAKTITVDGTFVSSDIDIQSTAANNRSSIHIDLGFGDEAALQGPAPDRIVITTGGYLESLSSTLLTNVDLTAPRVGSIVINGGVTLGPPIVDLNIDTTDAAATYGVKSILINGIVIAGQWNIASRVQKIIVGSIDNEPFRGISNEDFTLNVQGRVDELRVLEGLSGSFFATSFGSVRAGDMGGAIFGAQPLGRGENEIILESIDSFRSDTGGGFLAVAATGKIKQFYLGGSAGFVGIEAGSMDRLDVRGDLTNASFRINSGNLKQALFTGSLTDVSVDVFNGNIDVIEVGAMSDSRITAGIAVPSSTLAASSAAFTSQRTIGKVKLRPYNGNNLFENSVIQAHTITSVQSTLDVVTANGSVAFGVAAVNLGTVSFRVNSTTLFTGPNTFVDFAVRDL